MKTKALLAALALTLAPTVSLAAGCSYGHSKEEVAITCAAGSTYDQASKTCVPTTG